MTLSNIAAAIDTEHDNYRLIEVGLTTVDLTAHKTISTYSIPIAINFELSDEISKLTGWTTNKLRKQGVTHEEAGRRLTDLYGCCSRLLIVDSDDEIAYLNSVLLPRPIFGPKAQLSEHQINISTLHKLSTKNLKSVSLEETLENLGLKFEGRQHRASDDSFNIARVFIEMHKRMSNYGKI